MVVKAVAIVVFSSGGGGGVSGGGGGDYGDIYCVIMHLVFQ